VSLATKLKTFNRLELASIAFYAITGIILLAFLPLTGFPPHIGFLGILSLITAYSLFTKRAWAPWLVAILFVVATVFSLYTLYSTGFSNALTGISMIAYAVLTWVFTAYIILKTKQLET
jgi:formate hydrogenlyase subunit 3/multisubunit Na+/H+ antiporter MnhD subunit